MDSSKFIQVPQAGDRGSLFRSSYQAGLFSVFYSIGSKPLQLWGSSVRNGHIKRITDEDLNSLVLEIVGSNVETTSVICPAEKSQTLGIKLPIFSMQLKNLNKYFTFEVEVLDDQNMRRRFRASTFNTATKVKPFVCMMPLKLDKGWNQIQFNLADFTKRAYATNYVETTRVSIHANCRLRRIFFSDRLYSADEVPPEFRITMRGKQAEADRQAEETSLVVEKSICQSPRSPVKYAADRKISSPAASEMSTAASEGDLVPTSP